jgi:RNA polymerase sigma-70 factor (sigma-E family)
MPTARLGHTRADFERFVESCADDLLGAGYLIVGDLAEAEDLVQETLLRVARRWPRVRRMEHPEAYARRILVNLSIDDSKRRSRRRYELEPPPGAPPDTQADEAAARAFGTLDTRAELLGALSMLPPRQRAVLVLRYFEDLSETQVAQTLGCSLGTVKSTASRGLVRLREVLERDGASPAPNNGHMIGGNRMISQTKESQP